MYLSVALFTSLYRSISLYTSLYICISLYTSLYLSICTCLSLSPSLALLSSPLNLSLSYLSFLSLSPLLSPSELPSPSTCFCLSPSPLSRLGIELALSGTDAHTSQVHFIISLAPLHGHISQYFFQEEMQFILVNCTSSSNQLDFLFHNRKVNVMMLSRAH